MKMIGASVIIVITVIMLFLFSYSALAAPEGPGTVTRGASERRLYGVDNTTGGMAIQAQAGNVTALNINSTRITSRWQGYYGNVTGQITLDDANNATLYDWQIASPQGEIYASNGSETGAVAWTNVFCFNYTNNKSIDSGGARIQDFNGTDLEAMIGANGYDKDSLNATFNSTYTGSFQVGTVTINSQGSCKMTRLYANDAAQQTLFTEVLLTDNRSIIYTALLEQNQVGFQGAPVDFQLIVGENGDVEAPTVYYFFVELT